MGVPADDDVPTGEAEVEGIEGEVSVGEQDCAPLIGELEDSRGVDDPGPAEGVGRITVAPHQDWFGGLA